MKKWIPVAKGTWVINDGKTTLQQKILEDERCTLERSRNFLKNGRRRSPELQTELYVQFCDEVFAERRFICQREFNALIMMRFNGNSSYYRRRMIQLNLITEKSTLIKPVNT